MSGRQSPAVSATSRAVKTIHDEHDRAEIVYRIHALDPDRANRWGKMSAAQMLEHCALFDRWIQSGKPNRQTLIGKVVGRRVLNRMLRPDKAMARNVPTMPELVPAATVEFSAARDAWLSSLEDYAGYSAETFVHDFFGPLSFEEVGAFVWKHADHHLKQFGA